MHRQYVPESASTGHAWECLVKDLERGKSVGTPTEIEWHPHSHKEPCIDACRIVSLETLDAST